MMQATYYQILGLGVTASPEAIRRRYRELARRHHPDVSGDRPAAHQMFLAISEAYQVLIDPRRRAEYDGWLATRLEVAGARERGSEGARERESERGGAPGTVPDEAGSGAACPMPGGTGEKPSSAGHEGRRRTSATSARGSGQRAAGTIPAEPVFGAGTRVEVDFGGMVLECRVREYQGRRLHLTTPPGARRSPQFREGVPVRLTLYQSGVCLETETRTREWIWRQPPVVVVGPLEEWQERRRRSAVRARRELRARLVLETGTPAASCPLTLVGRSQDVSASGVLLLVAADGDVRPGLIGRLTMSEGDRMWAEDLPVRVARVRQWLRSSGRAMEIGLQLDGEDTASRQHWDEAVTRLGGEE